MYAAVFPQSLQWILIFCYCSMNPVAPTMMVKVLNRIISQEAKMVNTNLLLNFIVSVFGTSWIYGQRFLTQHIYLLRFFFFLKNAICISVSWILYILKFFSFILSFSYFSPFVFRVALQSHLLKWWSQLQCQVVEMSGQQLTPCSLLVDVVSHNFSMKHNEEYLSYLFLSVISTCLH